MINFIDTLSNFRIFGLCVAVILFFFSFIKLRNYDFPKSISLFLILFSILIFIFSLNPKVINIFIYYFEDFNKPLGRIIIILIIFFIVLVFFILRSFNDLNNKISELKLNFEYNLDYSKILNVNKNKILNSYVILIPSYNEEKNLKILIKKIPKKIYNKRIFTIIINDGSTDRTEEIIKNTFKKSNMLSIKNNTNLGGGESLRKGFEFLKKIGFKGNLITMDADCQHDPNEIKNLLYPIIKNDFDITLGSRVKGMHQATSKTRLIGIYFFSNLFSILFGKKFTDISNGFRAMKFEKIKKIHFYEKQYHTCEFLIKCLKNNLKIKEVGVSVKKRYSGISKKGNNLFYGFNFFKVLTYSFLFR